MPPKPIPQSEADAEFYNIDFSYQTQLRLAAGQSPASLQSKNFALFLFISGIMYRIAKVNFDLL